MDPNIDRFESLKLAEKNFEEFRKQSQKRESEGKNIVMSSEEYYQFCQRNDILFSEISSKNDVESCHQALEDLVLEVYLKTVKKMTKPKASTTKLADGTSINKIKNQGLKSQGSLRRMFSFTQQIPKFFGPGSGHEQQQSSNLGKIDENEMNDNKNASNLNTSTNTNTNTTTNTSRSSFDRTSKRLSDSSLEKVSRTQSLDENNLMDYRMGYDNRVPHPRLF